MRQRCEDILRRMILGEEELSLDEAGHCVTLLKGCSTNAQKASVANSFVNAIGLLQIGLSHELPPNIMLKLRAEALGALKLLVDLCDTEPKLRAGAPGDGAGFPAEHERL